MEQLPERVLIDEEQQVRDLILGRTYLVATGPGLPGAVLSGAIVPVSRYPYENTANALDSIAHSGRASNFNIEPFIGVLVFKGPSDHAQGELLIFYAETIWRERDEDGGDAYVIVRAAVMERIQHIKSRRPRAAQAGGAGRSDGGGASCPIALLPPFAAAQAAKERREREDLEQEVLRLTLYGGAEQQAAKARTEHLEREVLTLQAQQAPLQAQAQADALALAQAQAQIFALRVQLRGHERAQEQVQLGLAGTGGAGSAELFPHKNPLPALDAIDRAPRLRPGQRTWQYQ